ncbi:DUF7683 domain-containing protein [Nocardia sp. NBC_01329]|uniref:DUF7683 domain-containing protein n=1 Tax=Nocardia sp. NBC_01329 TaxID=2903594 RepID=UPI002E0E1C52|nr:hypothetical protein OG405_27525 [Nocardia sp. NBC_01329]
MKYSITTFEKGSDALIEEVEVEVCNVDALAALFREPVETFVNVYPISSAEAVGLVEMFGIDLDLAAADYFLEVSE